MPSTNDGLINGQKYNSGLFIEMFENKYNI